MTGLACMTGSGSRIWASVRSAQERRYGLLKFCYTFRTVSQKVFRDETSPLDMFQI